MRGATVILMAGLSLDMLKQLDAVLPEDTVVVLEAPAVLAARGLNPARIRSRALRRMVVSDYRGSDDYLDEVARDDLVAVLPANEYAVRAAAAIAASRRLPGAGLAAADAMTDKILLRQVAAAADLRQPRWAAVSGPAHARETALGWGGDAVLKPADRAGNVGVRILGADDDFGAAWTEMQREAAADPLLVVDSGPVRAILEERVTGPEYSVEVLVRDGVVIWSNVTRKHVLQGPYPVEMGHDLPAPPGDLVRQLDGASRSLIDATAFGSGIAHAEYVVRGGQPHLIECAARPPGDAITEMIGSAYGMSVVDQLVRVLSGRPAQTPEATGGAAVRFVAARPGLVRGLRGVERARQVPGVVDVEMYLEAGATARATTNSWTRAGIVRTSADSVSAAAAAAEQALAQIIVDMEPEPCEG